MINLLILPDRAFNPSAADEGAKAPQSRRLCLALLKNPAVMNPLLTFMVIHSSETPSKDIEWAAMFAQTVLYTLRTGSRRPGIRIGVDNTWAETR